MSSELGNAARPKRRWKKAAAIAAIVVLTLHLAVLIAVPPLIMSDIVDQRVERPRHDPADYGVEAERIALTTEDGLVLASWRVRCQAARGTVVILSGIQNPSVTAFFGYARMLSDAGWDSLLIEMRARNDSQGEETGLGMTEWLDVKAGVEYLKADDTAGGLPVVAMGTSMGAATVIIAGGEIPEIDGVISLSAFSTWPDVFADTMAHMGAPRYLCTLEKPFVSLYLGFHYGFRSLQYSPKNAIAKLGERPLLLMHSTGDSEVPLPSYEALFAEAGRRGANVSSFVREGDEHFICYEAHFDTPWEDQEFHGAILDFLNAGFA